MAALAESERIDLLLAAGESSLLEPSEGLLLLAQVGEEPLGSGVRFGRLGGSVIGGERRRLAERPSEVGRGLVERRT